MLKKAYDDGYADEAVEAIIKYDDKAVEALRKVPGRECAETIIKLNTAAIDIIKSLDDTLLIDFLSVACIQKDIYFEILNEYDAQREDIIHYTIEHGNEFATELILYYSKNGYHGIEILIDRLKSINLFIYSDFSDNKFKDNVDLFRSKLPIWAQHRGNYAYCRLDVENTTKKDFFAHSGINSEVESVKDSGISILPVNPAFNTFHVNAENIIDAENSYDRVIDTENKILCDIAGSLGNRYSVSGNITLYTYLKPCISCESVLAQFKEMYPNITITVVYEEKY